MMKKPPTKILFIGLDSADKDLLLRWSDEGLLPNLRALREQGPWGAIAAPPGFGAGDTMWRLFNTGVSSSQHVRYADGTGPPQASARAEIEPFWNRIVQAGYKVAVIDVPNIRTVGSFNGIHLQDWGVHEPYFERARSWPPELAEEIGERLILGPGGLRFRQACCDGPRRDAAGYREFRDSLLMQIERKTALACRYLDQGGWDLFMTAFSEAHCAGHQCWHLHAASHPWHDPALAASAGDPIRDIYIALDAAIGRLIEHAGPNACAIVYACPGMGPSYNGNHLLDEILRRLEGPAASLKPGMRLTGSLGTPWRHIPKSLREIAHPFAARVYRAVIARDRGRRRCFQVPYHDSHGAIRIGVAGRDPDGRIHEGQEYEQFCDALIDDLLKVVNPDNGGALVANVLRTDKLFAGQTLTGVPDLLVEWNAEAPISSAYSRKIGMVEKAAVLSQLRRSNQAQRSGDHRLHGVFAARGRDLAAGELREPVSVLDFAPTISAMLGVAQTGLEGTSVSCLREATALR